MSGNGKIERQNQSNGQHHPQTIPPKNRVRPAKQWRYGKYQQNSCSRSKFLSKIFKINVKNFREIFPDFTHRKRGSDFITVPFLSSGSHALRLPSAFPFSVPCLEYTLSVLQQSNLTPHISGLYALPSN